MRALNTKSSPSPGELFTVVVLFRRRAEVEELCRGSLEAVSSLYPALRNLQSLRELESVKPLFSR